MVEKKQIRFVALGRQWTVTLAGAPLERIKALHARRGGTWPDLVLAGMTDDDLGRLVDALGFDVQTVVKIAHVLLATRRGGFAGEKLQEWLDKDPHAI